MVQDDKGWPKGENLTKLVSADKIVVLYGRLKPQKEGEPDPPLHPVWYLLIEVEGVTNKQDHQIVRHIPKSVYKELIEAIKKDKAMEQSSLLQMQAYGDNAKALHPKHNGFVQVTKGEEPKTACIMPKVEKKKEGEGSSKEPAPKKAPPKKDDKAEKEAEKPAEKKAAASSRSPLEAQAVGDQGGRGQVRPGAGGQGGRCRSRGREEGRGAAGQEAEGRLRQEGREARREGRGRPGPHGPHSRGRPGRRLRGHQAHRRGQRHSLQLKKRRTESIESHEFMICDPDIKSIDFEVPPGATMGKATFTWSFE